VFLQKYETELYKDFYINNLYVDVIVLLFTDGLTLIAWTKGSLRGNVLNYVINQDTMRNKISTSVTEIIAFRGEEHIRENLF